MHRSKNAFTMVELVFVIVILGILAAVAIPKMAATRSDADITKGRADIASIRSGIVSERQARLITGDSSWIANGSGADQMDEGGLFGGVLMYPIPNKAGQNGEWSATAGTGTYKFRVMGVDNTFTYTPADGKFLCTAGQHCSKLVD